RTLYVYFIVIADIARTRRSRHRIIIVFRRHDLIQRIGIAHHLGVQVETLHAQPEAEDHFVESELVLDIGGLVQGAKRRYREVADTLSIAAGKEVVEREITRLLFTRVAVTVITDEVLVGELARREHVEVQLVGTQFIDTHISLRRYTERFADLSVKLVV